MIVGFEFETVRFSDLKAGEVFCEKATSRVYIKIIKDCKDNHLFNAVFLPNGKPCKFNDNAQVEKLNAELTVKK